MTEGLYVGMRVMFRTPERKIRTGIIKSISGNGVEIDDASIGIPTREELARWALCADETKHYEISIQRSRLPITGVN